MVLTDYQLGLNSIDSLDGCNIAIDETTMIRD